MLEVFAFYFEYALQFFLVNQPGATFTDVSFSRESFKHDSL